MGGEQRRVVLVTQLLEERGAALDVAEDEGDLPDGRFGIAASIRPPRSRETGA
jgi:hypothetical protein